MPATLARVGDMTTFASLLARRLRDDPARPLVTYYDEATGERTELSVVTYANWVAKASGLLADEHELERGQRLRLDLPPHWLTTVFLGAAWNVGLTVTEDEPDAVVCGPATVETWAARAHDETVLACSLLPLGMRFEEPLPAGVHDVGVEIWGQPDGFAPWDPPTDDDLAVDAQTNADWWAAAAGASLPSGSRLMVEVGRASPPQPTSAEPFALVFAQVVTTLSGSLVLVRGADSDRLDAIAREEKVTTLAWPGTVSEH